VNKCFTSPTPIKISPPVLELRKEITVFSSLSLSSLLNSVVSGISEVFTNRG
jgi:hypothetical protein